MRRFLSLLLLTLWLLMNGSASYAFSKSSDIKTNIKTLLNFERSNSKLSCISQSIVSDDDNGLYYEEEEEDEDDDFLHSNTRLQHTDIYQILFLFDGFSAASQYPIPHAEKVAKCTPVYLVCQNFRI